MATSPLSSIPPVTSSTNPWTPVSNPRKDEILSKMSQIVEDAGGFSNVGMTSEYWELRKELQRF